MQTESRRWLGLGFERWLVMKGIFFGDFTSEEFKIFPRQHDSATRRRQQHRLKRPTESQLWRFLSVNQDLKEEHCQCLSVSLIPSSLFVSRFSSLTPLQRKSPGVCSISLAVEFKNLTSVLMFVLVQYVSAVRCCSASVWWCYDFIFLYVMSPTYQHYFNWQEVQDSLFPPWTFAAGVNGLMDFARF